LGVGFGFLVSVFCFLFVFSSIFTWCWWLGGKPKVSLDDLLSGFQEQDDDEDFEAKEGWEEREESLGACNMD
jgi:hypothetical protein